METETLAPPVANKIPTSPNTDLNEIHRLYNLQKANLQNLKRTTAKERKAKLRKMKDVCFEYREQIEIAVNKDLRKAFIETDYAEIYNTVAEIRYAISNLDKWMAPHEVDTPMLFIGSASKVVFEPKGMVLLMTPWNYPFQMPMQHLVTSVAAGNAAIIKPSEFTPHTSALVKEMVGKIFPENEVAVVEGDHSVSTELLKLKFDHIHFTGSPAVGKVVMRAAAEYLTSVTLELGGKSPVIIDETANIDAAVKKMTWGKFLNVGQTCIAPDYVLIHESKKDEFVAKFKTNLDKSFGADPKQSMDLSRIINNKHFKRIKALLADAVKDGAVIEVGGQDDESQNYIAPTLITNVSLESKIMKEEIFGPVLPIMTYKNLDDALKIVNEKEKPLALYVFSGKSKVADYVVDNTSAGGTCINDNLVHITQPNLPFGGVNNSGIGKSMGYYGFKEFSNERAVLKALHSGSIATPLWYPYGKLTKGITELMLKYF
jgi:aldehyde dehydrogenase (NAD+)